MLYRRAKRLTLTNMFVKTGLSVSIYFRPWPHLTITGTKNIVLYTKDFVI